MNSNLMQLQANLKSQLDQVNSLLTAQKPVAQPNINDMITQAVQKQMANLAPAATLLNSIGSGMSIEDQQWLSANLNKLPEFFGAGEGKEVLGLAIEAYKKYCGVEAK